MDDHVARDGVVRRVGRYFGLIPPRPGEQPGRLTRALTLTEASRRSDARRVFLVNLLLVVLIGGRAGREDGWWRFFSGLAAFILLGGLIRTAVMYRRLPR